MRVLPVSAFLSFDSNDPDSSLRHHCSHFILSIAFINKPTAYSPENQDYTTIVKIDCRGLELIGFEPRSGWKAKGEESGTVFEDIDLTSGDWADYDEKVRHCCFCTMPNVTPKRVITDPCMLFSLQSELPVAINSVEYRFVKDAK